MQILHLEMSKLFLPIRGGADPLSNRPQNFWVSRLKHPAVLFTFLDIMRESLGLIFPGSGRLPSGKEQRYLNW